MRPVLHGDVVSAARALLAASPALRAGLADRLLDEAACARAFNQRHGHPHALFGDGSLQSAASKRTLAAEPFLCNPDYCACMMLVLQALLSRVRR